MGAVRVGVSGWRYPRWRGDFYPAGLPQRAELAYCAERMGAVELNGSFYSLQRASSYLRWRDEVDGAHLAVKGSRYITHMLRLRGGATPLATFLASGLLALGDRLGPVLWQLPARHVLDVEQLDAFLALLPGTVGEAAALAREHDPAKVREAVLDPAPGVPPDRPVRHVLEPRHTSFDSPEAAAVLARHGVACVLADSAGHFPVVDLDTTDVRYVRLHGEEALYAGGYGSGSLDAWAERCRSWAEHHDVWVLFDNDADGRAPHDALALQARLGDVATTA